MHLPQFLSYANIYSSFVLTGQIRFATRFKDSIFNMPYFIA